jgi:hypothetical protein
MENNNQLNYQVIDNFLSLDDFETLKSIILDKDFLWQVNVDNDKNTLFLELLHYINNQPTSEFYNELVPIMKKIDVLGLVQIKSNLYIGNNYIQSFKKEKEYDFSLGTAIYYLNSNDGYTLLEDGTKIESRENRIVIFESTSYYYETNCSDNTCRVNITFNYF